ncbi:MAG TPA: ROK family protein [Candidatus Sulfotelmatobacter sp.]|nr:ROK family protein [Candidatus Sulfotelmatobacter sp.]
MPSVEARDDLVIGVDIGGTKVAAGLVNRSGEILFHTRNPMVSNDGAASALASVIEAIETASANAANSASMHGPIRGIGICAPGPLDPRTGVVLNPPNLPCWRDFPLAAELARTYRVQVKVDNDANAAGLAETLWGSGRGYRYVFYVTIGTGIGTAILLNGRIYHGRTGAAAEGGHLSIDYNGPRCGCGKRGCIEILAAGPAIARRARAKLATGRTSSLLDLAGGTLDNLTSKMVGEAAVAGDPAAKEVLQETVHLLSFWFGNIVDLLEPDVMIVGGGVASMLQPFLDEIRDRLPGCCVNQRCKEIPLVLARYGEDSGVAGGAALCFDAPGFDAPGFDAPGDSSDPPADPSVSSPQ